MVNEDSTIYTCPEAAFGDYEIPYNESPKSVSRVDNWKEINERQISMLIGVNTQVRHIVEDFKLRIDSLRKTVQHLHNTKDIDKVNFLIQKMEEFISNIKKAKRD